jgi:hypothetical protein
VARFTLVLVALSGCDYAFGIPPVDEVRAPCGPYQNVRPVPIVGVAEPRQFSITPDESLALVFALDAQSRHRPIPLAWNGEAWEPHAQYQTGLAGRGIQGARLSPPEEIPNAQGLYAGPVQPAMNVWVVTSNRHEVDRFFWSGTNWTADAAQPGLFDGPDYDTRAGNVVVVKNAADSHRVRHTVITKFGVEVGIANQIVLFANNLPDYSLVKKERTDDLNLGAIENNIALGDAVLTDSQAILVYAGVSGGQSDVYATAQSPLREFATGGLIASITTTDDEVEPWINGTCSKLYFRRIPAGSPNDPGQIFVAE